MSNILLDVLSSAMFSGVPSNAVYDVLKGGYRKLTQQKPLDEMYLDAFAAAVEQEKPQLSTYAQDGEVGLNREDLRKALQADLGPDLGATSLSKLGESDVISRIASAMAARSVLSIGGNTLSEADYEQILRNLVRRAASNFTAAVLADEISFRAIILSEAKENLKLLADVRSYLTGRFGNALEQLEHKIDYQTDLLEQVAQVGPNAPFTPYEQYFSGFLNPKRLFTHDWVLVGRETVLGNLDTHVMAADTRVIVLPGRGGIGKTKVLYAFAERFVNEHPGNVMRFVREGIEIAGTAASLPPGPCVIVVDDAHRRHDLKVLFGMARSHASPATLVLATRPHAIDHVRSLLHNAGYDVREVVQLPKLKSLSHEEVKALARQALGDDHAHLLDRLVQVTKDSPLVTVVGGRLLAERGVDPLLLERESDFQDQVFSGFQDVLLGEVGDQSQSDLYKKLLPLVAAVMPVFLSDQRFLHDAAAYLGIDEPALMSALGNLEAAGVLQRNGSALRIIPDVLADHILHKACLTASGLPTGYAQQIFNRFAAVCPAQVLTNLAELDWRVQSADGTKTTLLNEVWQSLEDEFLHGSHATRCQILGYLDEVAYYQPARALHLVELAMDHPGADESESGTSPYGSYSHQDVLHRLPALLRQVGYSLEQLPRCCELLWQLGRDDARSTNSTTDHPIRVLAELGSYDPYKPLDYNRAMLQAAERWVEDGRAGSSLHSPLDAIDPLFAKTAETRRSDGLSITFNSYPLSPQRTEELRRRALNLVVATAQSPNLTTAIRATASLEKALHGPVPFGNSKMPDEQIQAWIPDQLATLEQIESVVAHTSHPLVHFQIRNILAWHAQNGAGKAVKDRSKCIIAAIPDSFEFRLVSVLLNGYEGWMLEDADDIEEAIHAAQARGTEMVRQGAAEFLEHYPDPQTGADLLDECMGWNKSLEEQPRINPSQLLAEVCRRDPEYGFQLCKIVIVAPDRPVSKSFHALLHAMREVDPDRASSMVQSALATNNGDLLASVACMYRFCDRISPEDIGNITSLLGHPDPVVKTHAIAALRKLGREDPETAIGLARQVAIGSSKDLAETLFGIFDPQHGIDPALLSENVVAELLTKLESVAAIDGLEVGQLLAHLCRAQPGLVVRMLLNRIAHGRSREPGYIAFPMDDLRQGLDGLADNAAFDDLLRQIRDAALETLESGIYSPLSKLFWQVSRAHVDRAVTVLNEWVIATSAEKLHALGELLRACPRALIFEHQAFVASLLEASVLVNEKCYRFLSAVLHQPRSGEAYSVQPPNEYENLQRKAAEAATRWATSQPVRQFYHRMAEDAALTIQQHRASFETVDDE